MRITLAVTAGPHAGKVFSFGGHDTFLVGRSKRAHFRLPEKDKYFSRVHFLIEVNPPQCVLIDMGSRNGTHVNNQRVSRASLKHGDQIRAGHTVLRVTFEEGAAGSGPVPVLPSAPTRTASPAGPAAPDVEPLFEVPEVRPVPISVTPVAPPPQAIPVAQVARPAPPPVPAARTTPGACRLCLAPAPGVVCAACQAQIDARKQTVPGYYLAREVGRGSMGIVYLALGLSDSQAVAVKMITPAAGGDRTQVQRFLREAEILRTLAHPHIVGFRDMGEAAGMLFFAMDFVRGQDAGRLLKQGGPMATGRAVRLAGQLLEAVAFAHERGYVHRDLKPSNMLVVPEAGRETVKLADFGLARMYQTSQLSGLTITGDVGGTVAYMPPEQITNYRDVGPAADQYSSAATLYHLLTGQYVYDLPSDFQKQLLLILMEDTVPIQRRRPDLPPGLCDLLQRALSRYPKDRFPSVRDMREALRPFEG
jgi:serine/threonine-protein kinase